MKIFFTILLPLNWNLGVATKFAFLENVLPSNVLFSLGSAAQQMEYTCTSVKEPFNIIDHSLFKSRRTN